MVMTVRMKLQIKGAEMGFLSRLADISLRNKVRSFVICEGVEPQLLDPVELVRASGRDASWSPPGGGVPSTSNWEETPGQAQVQVERLYLFSGLGTPWDPSVRVG